MASVGSLSSSTSANLYGTSIKGVGGLMSGLETDSLIEGMTTATRAKIAKQLQNKQKSQWEMDLCRSISDKLIAFSKKYTNLTSANSLYRDSFFDKSKAKILGTNSKFITVGGATDALDNIKILGIKQLAKNASMTVSGLGGAKEIATGEIDTSGEVLTATNLAGKSITINYGGKDYSLTMKAGEVLTDAGGEFKADYTTKAGTERALNALMEKTTVDGTPTAKLSDKVKITESGGGFSFRSVDPAETETITLSGDADALKTLGFDDGTGNIVNDGKIFEPGTVNGMSGSAVSEASLTQKKNFEDFIDGKSITFSYNGVKRTITLSKDEIDGSSASGSKDGKIDMDELQNYLNNKLSDAYGSGKITVSLTGTSADLSKGSLSIKTTDSSSVLEIVDGSSGLLGTDGALKVKNGANNRLDLQAPVTESLGIPSSSFVGGKMTMNIGSSTITINDTDSLKNVIEKMNKTGLVKVSYLETADRLSITAVNDGAAGNDVEFTGDFADALFGGSGSHKLTGGQDAILSVQYGEGGAPVDLIRSNNTFDLEGATVTLNGTFGYDSAGNVDGTADPIIFETSVDTDKIVKAVSDMINDYNELVEFINKETSTKPNRSYPPLTEDQKKEMSEDEIKAWNEKAKSGILFNDTTLNALSNELRFVFSGTIDTGALEKMGLTISSDYSENGKISFDEDKFKDALESDLDNIKDLFTKSASGNDKGGFMARMNSITEKYAKTSGIPKGSLIERAGSTSSPSSVTENKLQKKMDEIDKLVSELKKKLQNEIDRYTKQFSQLEQVIAQMNAQSGWLNQS